MKSIALLIICSTLLGAVPEEASSRLGLDQAKKHAIAHNFEVIALRNAYEEAKAGSRRARSGYFPTVGVAGGADSDISANTNQSVSLGYLYGKYNLFRGFQDAYRSEMADLDQEIAKVKLERAEFRVGLDVEQVFHLYLFKKGALALREEAIKVNDKHKKMAIQRKSAGMASDADVMEFDLRDAFLRSDVLTLQQELESARTNLKRLLGEEIGSSIEPIGTLQHQHLKGSLMDYVKRIKGESEQVLVASRSHQSANIESKIWRTKWLPQLDLEVEAGYLPIIKRPPNGGANVSAMVVAKLDLFNGFDTVAEKQQTEARRLKAEAQLKNAVLTAVTDMEIAYRKIKTIQAKVDLEEQNASRSDRYYKAVLSGYSRGIRTSEDLKVAAELLYDVHLRREAYKYDFLSEKIALEKALGGRVDAEVVKEEHQH